MRKYAFIIGILGLGFLVGFLFRGPVSVDKLDGMEIGSMVYISGIVDSERKFGNGKLLIIEENDILVYCECTKDYAGLNVLVSGIVERFPDDLRIRAFKVEVLD
ncbi:MAG: hypothetical protein AABW89_01605 [Nanoarchaeota archaeon]